MSGCNKASHLTSSSDAFASALLEDPSKYCVAFLEAWTLEDFEFLTASRRELSDACILTVIAEAVMAELFDTYARSSSLTTPSGIAVSGANRDDPLTQALHLPAHATYHW